MQSSSAASGASRSILSRALSLLTDLRFLRVVGQLVFLALLVFLLAQVWNNILAALEANNLNPNLEFMNNRAGFEIGGARDYSPNDSYWEAFRVGLENTVSVVIAGLVGATVLGIVAGILLLSRNWLVQNITRFFVEILRNSPLLVVIFVMFFVVVLALPQLRDSLTFPQESIVTLPTSWLILGGVAIGLWLWLRRAEPGKRQFWWTAFLTAVVTLIVIYVVRPAERGMWLSLYDADGALNIRFIGAALALAGGLVASAIFLKDAARDMALAVLAGIAAALAVYAFGVLPSGGLRFETRPVVWLNNRGLTYPEIWATGRFAEWAAFVTIGLGFAIALFYYLRRLTELTGKPYPRIRLALLALVVFTVLGWVIVTSEPVQETIIVAQDGALVEMPVSQAVEEELITREQSLAYMRAPLDVVLPERQGLRMGSGDTLSPEYVALLLALVIYTAAFIAEIVRAGILAVPRGQLEAARALGLSYSQLLRMVILPQALRVIIPPLTNQYLNLAKNSSLAVAISFADVYQVMFTVGNQSGQSVTTIIIVMVTYLALSLIISAIMNWVNARFQLVTR
jgi:general L-amino acid transport system permease protein